MSWIPEAGFYSLEEFDSTSGSSSTTSYQGITGGHVTLFPILTSTTGYLDSWERVDNWTFTNNLYNYTGVTGSFTVRSGAVYSNQTPVSSYQRLLFAAGAWEVYSEYPVYVSGQGYSGQSVQSFSLETGTSNVWCNYFTGGGTSATIEFDVVSLVNISGRTFTGFSSSQNNSTSIGPISSGFVNHGIYIDNDTYWEYVELTPSGIQLLNHPDIALPLDLTVPQSVRLGINGQDIYLSDSNGNVVAGISKLDTATLNTSTPTAKISFGAPLISGNDYELYRRDISGVVGNTYWDNIKILIGHSVINMPSGSRQSYSTTASTFYTAPFNPKIGISSFNNAVISFIPYSGGSTVVTAQYSGSAGWVDSSSISLVGQSSPYNLSLTSIPVYTYSSGEYSIDNYLRFKIVQTSNGTSPSSPVESIAIYSNASSSLLDIYPTWKAANLTRKVYLGINNSEFYSTPTELQKWSTTYIKADNSTGEISSITNEVNDSAVNGNGEIIIGGNYDTLIRNFRFDTITAISGSSAESIFGRDPVYNIFENEYLSLNYTPVEFANYYVTGRVYGNIASDSYIPSLYTGNAIINYLKKSVHRPASQTSFSRFNHIFDSSQQEYAQLVYIPENTCSTYNGTEGIEFKIPSGIAVGNLLATFDIQFNQGSGLYISSTGSVSSTDSITLYRGDNSFFEVSVPFIGTTGEVRLSLTVPSGTVGTIPYEFTVSRVTVNPYTLSNFTKSSHAISYSHSGFINNDSPFDNTISPVYKGTSFSCDLTLNSYPTGIAIIAKKTKTSDGKGFTFSVNSQGYPVLQYDLEAQTLLNASGSTTLSTQTLGTNYLTGLSRIPINKNISVGFCHTASPYSKFAWAEYPSGNVHNIAAANKTYITLDGYLVGVKDNMSSWNNLSGRDPVPYISYIPDGTGPLVLMSGAFMEFDALNLIDAPISFPEVELSIDGAKNTPYFVPDKFTKPNSGSFIFHTGVSYTYGSDLDIVAIYNLANPGYTNWDHGPQGNHLIFYGSPSSQLTEGPYGLGYTSFDQSNYAQAKYSSSFDRLFNTTGDLQLSYQTFTTGRYNQGCIDIYGWFRSNNTGEFIYLLENESILTSGYISLGLNSNSNITTTRISSTGDLVWQCTGRVFSTGEWNWVQATISAKGYTGANSTGVRYVRYEYEDGQIDTFNTSTGINYGIQYYGRSGTSKTSAFMLGKGVQVDLCDITISFSDISNPVSGRSTLASASKGGSYNVVLYNEAIHTGVNWTAFNTGELLLGVSNPGQSLLMVAAHNSYYNTPRLNGGINLLDDEQFLQADGYSFAYNEDNLKKYIGSNDSPFSLGYSVPDNAINIAKITLPKHTVDSSISTFNLNQYLNSAQENKSISRNGGQVSSSSISGYYNGINHYLMTGRGDVVFSGLSIQPDILISTVSAFDEESLYGEPLYYCYLLGRGDRLLYLRDAYYHNTGQISHTTTGSSVTPFIDNLTKIRSSIYITDSAGNRIPTSEYPFDIISTPHTIDDLYFASQSGLDVDLDGIRYLNSTYTGLTNQGLYTVIMLLPSIPDRTYWANYSSYNTITSNIENISEVINPMPIFRERYEFENPRPGVYTISPDHISYQNYNISMFGIDGGYTGVI